MSDDYFLQGPRVWIVCLFFLAAFGLLTLLVSFAFGFLWVLDWAWGLR